MFLARRPSPLAVDRFTAKSQELSLSYSPIGLAQAHAPGFMVDETNVVLGRGSADFDRAKAALIAWKPFDLGWVQLFPSRASLTPGTVVTVLVRHLGFWSLNGCRIVYGLGDRDRGTRFGFAYGTLSNHAESGEELFEVSLQPETGNVIYRVRAVSRPRAPLARLGYPLTRALQARFRQESAAAMRRDIRADFTSS
jgi:uncharacterized protein (UPF0548 family)